jgi:perosamine synthetase
MVVLMCGAIPVFADINPHTGNIDPDSVLKKITPKTKAVLCVHWGGLSCEMKYLSDCIQKRDCCLDDMIPVIEDAAHALGATYCGSPVGSLDWSRMCCFSFQATKLLNSADGGCVCCEWWDDLIGLESRRWFGIPRNEEVGFLGERDYILEDVGFKYHLSDFNASLGLANLQTFPQRLKRRQEIGNRYRQELEGVRGVELLHFPSYCNHAYYFFSMKVDRRYDFIKKMKEKEIPVSVVNRRIDKHPVFGGVREELVGMKEFEEKHIALPCHDGLTDENVNTIIQAVLGGW